LFKKLTEFTWLAALMMLIAVSIAFAIFASLGVPMIE
jgi:hypothetical protein